ncbi:MAG: hypothetical protein ACE5I4_00300 [Thermoplasmata archaeon]
MTGWHVRTVHRVGVIALLALVLLWPAAQPGLSETIPLSERASIGQTENGVGSAFDGSHVWYTLGYAPDTNIYRIDPATDTVVATLDMSVLTDGRQIVPGGLAWDPTREHLWVGTMLDLDAVDQNSFGDGDIFEVDPVAEVVVSSFSTRSITEAEEPLTGIIDGLAFDTHTDTLWFSPLESVHLYEVTTEGIPVSSFALPFPTELWGAGLTSDGVHLWTSLRTGGIARGELDGFSEVSLAEFTRSGTLLRLVGFPSEMQPLGSEDLAFDAATFAPGCVVWLTSIVATLTALEVPCPLQTEATLAPGDSLALEVELALDSLAAGGVEQPFADVWWEVDCQSAGISVTLEPEVVVEAEVGASLVFGETVEVSADTSPGEYHCTVTFFVEVRPDEGAPFEQQSIWITVEAPEETPQEPDYLEILVDIKPGSCRNPFNVKSQGVLPVAILGTENFDVSEVETVTIELYTELGSLAPLRWAVEDVAAAYDGGDGCDEEGPDGYLDLTLKFDTQAVVELLGEVSDGDVLYLEFHGLLFDGTSFEGGDSVEILKKGKK